MDSSALVQIFSRVLDDQEVDCGTDFFENGGDSLLATRVLSAVAREYGVELTLEDFIAAPTPDGLSAKLASVPA